MKLGGWGILWGKCKKKNQNQPTRNQPAKGAIAWQGDCDEQQQAWNGMSTKMEKLALCPSNGSHRPTEQLEPTEITTKWNCKWNCDQLEIATKWNCEQIGKLLTNEIANKLSTELKLNSSGHQKKRWEQCVRHRWNKPKQGNNATMHQCNKSDLQRNQATI